MTAPKRDPRALLATGGLLLIPLAALWLVLSPRLSRHEGPPSSPVGGSETPRGVALPAARVAAGDLTQGEWTLLGVTRLVQMGIATPPSSPALPTSSAPPPPTPTALTPSAGGRTGGPTLMSPSLMPATVPLRAEPSTASRNPPVMSGGAGTGLWIGVRGGLGIKTLTIPQDGRPHAYPLGHAVFVVQAAPRSRGYLSNSDTIRWTAPNGAPLSGEPPYQVWFEGESAAPGDPATQMVTLVPSPLSGRFQVMAQPLTTDGRAVGRAIGLLCQPVTATALFTQIPVGYNTRTQQFRVTVARAGTKTGGASWQITDLPPSVQNGPDDLPSNATARLGPFVLRAVAAEAEDTSGLMYFVSRHLDRLAPPSQNLDGHGWTGVPTIRCLLTARTVTPMPAAQSWMLRLDRVTPQWSTPPLASSVFFFTDFFPLASARPTSEECLIQDAEVGAAYAGQQHWIKMDGTARRVATRTETLTFHDADVVYDAAFGGDRLVWRHPETETTRAGIAVTVLNGSPGRRVTNAAQPGSPDWWYDRGNAELLLAWRLPHGIVFRQHAAADSPRVAEPPQGSGPLLAVWDTAHPAPYSRWSALPGATDAQPLIQTGYSILRLSVWAPPMPNGTPAPPNGMPAPPTFLPGVPPLSPPLPRHLKTLTLQITLHEEQERRPLHLVVPVRPSLPPGAYPNARRAAPTLSPLLSFSQAPSFVEQRTTREGRGGPGTSSLSHF